MPECLDGGVVAGLCIACVLATLIVTLLAFLVYRWRKKTGGSALLASKTHPSDPGGEGAYVYDNPYFQTDDETGHAGVRGNNVRVAPDKKNDLHRNKVNGQTESKPKESNSSGPKHLVVKAKKNKSSLPIPFSDSERVTADDSNLINKDEVIHVPLKSHDFTGLGFDIEGNMREGIFVKNVFHRGPASESGKMTQGDRILSVTVSFINMVYEDALHILSYASPYEVVLEIQRLDGNRNKGFLQPSQSSEDVRDGGSDRDERDGVDGRDGRNGKGVGESDEKILWKPEKIVEKEKKFEARQGTDRVAPISDTGKAIAQRHLPEYVPAVDIVESANKDRTKPEKIREDERMREMKRDEERLTEKKSKSSKKDSKKDSKKKKQKKEKNGKERGESEKERKNKDEKTKDKEGAKKGEEIVVDADVDKVKVVEDTVMTSIKDTSPVTISPGHKKRRAPSPPLIRVEEVKPVEVEAGEKKHTGGSSMSSSDDEEAKKDVEAYKLKEAYAELSSEDKLDVLRLSYEDAQGKRVETRKDEISLSSSSSDEGKDGARTKLTIPVSQGKVGGGDEKRKKKSKGRGSSPSSISSSDEEKEGNRRENERKRVGKGKKRKSISSPSSSDLEKDQGPVGSKTGEKILVLGGRDSDDGGRAKEQHEKKAPEMEIQTAEKNDGGEKLDSDGNEGKLFEWDYNVPSAASVPAPNLSHPLPGDVNTDADVQSEHMYEDLDKDKNVVKIKLSADEPAPKLPSSTSSSSSSSSAASSLSGSPHTSPHLPSKEQHPAPSLITVLPPELAAASRPPPLNTSSPETTTASQPPPPTHMVLPGLTTASQPPPHPTSAGGSNSSSDEHETRLDLLAEIEDEVVKHQLQDASKTSVETSESADTQYTSLSPEHEGELHLSPPPTHDASHPDIDIHTSHSTSITSPSPEVYLLSEEDLEQASGMQSPFKVLESRRSGGDIQYSEFKLLPANENGDHHSRSSSKSSRSSSGSRSSSEGGTGRNGDSYNKNQNTDNDVIPVEPNTKTSSVYLKIGDADGGTGWSDVRWSGEPRAESPDLPVLIPAEDADDGDMSTEERRQVTQITLDSDSGVTTTQTHTYYSKVTVPHAQGDGEAVPEGIDPDQYQQFLQFQHQLVKQQEQLNRMGLPVPEPVPAGTAPSVVVSAAPPVAVDRRRSHSSSSSSSTSSAHDA